MNEIINNWDLILNTFKNECDIQNLSFTTFIKPLQVISVSDNEITLLSDTQMSANYVEKRYLKFLEVTISEIMKKDYKLRIISEDTLNEETAKKTAQESSPNKNISLNLKQKNKFKKLFFHSLQSPFYLIPVIVIPSINCFWKIKYIIIIGIITKTPALIEVQ